MKSILFDYETNAHLIDDFNYLDTVKELKDKLFDWMRRTDDPLLNGKFKDHRTKPPLKY